MGSNKTIVYALLTLDRKNDVIKIINLNSPMINKYINNMIEMNRKDIPYINASDSDGYIDNEAIISDEDDNAVVFFESVLKLINDNLIHECTKLRIINKKIYSGLIKENNINDIINTCMAIKPKYDYDILTLNNEISEGV